MHDASVKTAIEAEADVNIGRCYVGAGPGKADTDISIPQ
jgi:hypothetical protein